MITTGMQIQTIGDLMHGHQPILSRGQLDEDFQWLYDLVIDDPGQAYQTLAQLKLSPEATDLIEVIDRIMVVEPGYRPHYPSLAEIAPTLPEVTWLWESWVPRGYITMLAAWPGVGGLVLR